MKSSATQRRENLHLLVQSPSDCSNNQVCLTEAGIQVSLWVTHVAKRGPRARAFLCLLRITETGSKQNSQALKQHSGLPAFPVVVHPLHLLRVYSSALLNVLADFPAPVSGTQQLIQFLHLRIHLFWFLHVSETSVWPVGLVSFT